MATKSAAPAVKKAAKILGGQAKLARALGIFPVNVANWITKDVSRHRPVPPAKCVAIEHLTGGKVTRRELRPNDWRDLWPELVDNGGK